MVRCDSHRKDLDAQVFGLIHCILQTPTWFLVALERMPVSHHDQILVLLQVGTPGEVGSVRILSRAQSPETRAAEILRAEAQEKNLRQLWTCWPLSRRDQVFTVDHNYKVSGLVGLQCLQKSLRDVRFQERHQSSACTLNGHHLKMPWTPKL